MKHRYAHLFITFAVYWLVVIFLGNKLGIASNYFILLPLIATSLSFGFYGGIIAGILALPLNLLLFYIIGHIEYAPESLIITELFGILVGTVLGYASDFFKKLIKEIERRRMSEIALELMVKDKEILLKEINHRVKNNLNLIKSIIQLQANRIRSKKHKEELIKLTQRIISIALVQDLLFSQDSLDMLDFRQYMTEIIDNLFSGYHDKNISYELQIGDHPLYLESKKITSLGLIVNEVVTNAVKYAFPKKRSPKFHIHLTQNKGYFNLRFHDNGPGYPEQMNDEGLGLKLIKTLTANLDGTMEILNENGGVMILNFPIRGIYEEEY